MSRFKKEIMIGFIPVIIGFLLFIQVNVLPLLFVGAVAFVILYYTKLRSNGGMTNTRKTKAKAPSYLSFDDIGGQERAKQELREGLEFLIKKDLTDRFGIRPMKGILLTGPPGTGKTLLAKAAAQFTGSVFLSSSGSEFVEMYVGVGASRVRDLFKDARQQAIKDKKESAIIFIDEIDAIGGKRDGGQQKEYDQTLNQLLTEMDGLESDESPQILLIAATNRKEMLDPALLRPGRFDRQIDVDLPDKKGRLHILRIHAKNKPLHDQVDLEKIAEETFGFSGAQLEAVMNEGAIYAMREDLQQIEQAQLSLAIDKVMMGEKTDRDSTKEERDRVAVHELGHALVAEMVRPGSVSQVCLSPRGKALGYVRHNPQKEQYLYTRSFLEQQIMITIGGSAAEELIYGDRSTGSKNDFEQALSIVSTMMDSGLTQLGIIDRKMVTTEQLMKENSLILDELTERTRSLLRQEQQVFVRALEIIQREEVLSGDKFRTLLHEQQQQQHEHQSTA